MPGRDLLARLRPRVEQLVEALARAELDAIEAHGTSARPPAYDRFRDLATRATFEAIAEELAAATEAGRAPEADLLARILEVVGSAVERLAAMPATTRRFELEAGLVLDAQGEDVPFGLLLGLARRSPDPDRRRSLENAIADGARRLAAAAADEHALAREAAAALGGEDYVSHRARLMRIDLDGLARQAEALLVATDDMARDAIARLARGRLRDDRPTRQADLWFAMRAADLDPLLSAGDLQRIDRLFRGAGLDPLAAGHVVRHERDARLQAGRPARTVVARVPDEVHLFLPAEPGLEGHVSLLHELGHALHAGHTDAALEFEVRTLGDRSVSEGYAVLLDHLVLSPIWGGRVLGLGRADRDEVVRTAAARALLAMRGQAARLLHEVAFHRDPAGARERYVELQRRAQGVEPLAELFLLDMEPAVASAYALRGQLFEGVAHFALRDRFDEDWFRNPRAGAYLRGLFASGYRRDLELLTHEELGQALDPTAAARRIEELLA